MKTPTQKTNKVLENIWRFCYIVVLALALYFLSIKPLTQMFGG